MNTSDFQHVTGEKGLPRSEKMPALSESDDRNIFSSFGEMFDTQKNSSTNLTAVGGLNQNVDNKNSEEISSRPAKPAFCFSLSNMRKSFAELKQVLSVDPSKSPSYEPSRKGPKGELLKDVSLVFNRKQQSLLGANLISDNHPSHSSPSDSQVKSPPDTLSNKQDAINGKSTDTIAASTPKVGRELETAQPFSEHTVPEQVGEITTQHTSHLSDSKTSCDSLVQVNSHNVIKFDNESSPQKWIILSETGDIEEDEFSCILSHLNHNEDSLDKSCKNKRKIDTLNSEKPCVTSLGIKKPSIHDSRPHGNNSISENVSDDLGIQVQAKPSHVNVGIDEISDPKKQHTSLLQEEEFPVYSESSIQNLPFAGYDATVQLTIMKKPPDHPQVTVQMSEPHVDNHLSVANEQENDGCHSISEKDSGNSVTPEEQSLSTAINNEKSMSGINSCPTSKEKWCHITKKPPKVLLKRLTLEANPGKQLAKSSDFGSTDDTSTKNDGSHECPSCLKRFPTFHLCTRHQETVHSKVKELSACPFCQKECATPLIFLQHYFIDHQEQVLPEEYRRAYQHYLMMQRKYKTKVFQVINKGKLFPKGSSNVTHGKVRDDPRRCSYCGKRFKKKGNCRIHMEKYHLKPESMTCSICGKHFVKPALYVKHFISVHKEKPVPAYYTALFRKYLLKYDTSMAFGIMLALLVESKMANDDNHKSKLDIGEMQVADEAKASVDIFKSSKESNHTYMSHTSIERSHSVTSRTQQDKTDHNMQSTTLSKKLSTTPYKKLESNQCPKCKKKFSSKSCCWRHVNTVHSVLRNLKKCPECSAPFNKTLPLVDHFLKQHKGKQMPERYRKPFQLYVRAKIFMRNGNRNRIQEAFPDKGSGVMCECGKEFSTAGNLSRHKKLYHKKTDAIRSKELPPKDQETVSSKKRNNRKQEDNSLMELCCPFCSRTYPTLTGLQSHIDSSHLSSESESQTSDVSKTETKNSASEKPGHVKVKEKQIYVCPLCNERFTSMNSVGVHFEKSHASLKVMLSTSETTKGSASSHGNNGDRNKPVDDGQNSDKQAYSCPVCSKFFNTMTSVNIHYEKQHTVVAKDSNNIYSKKHPVECPKCWRSFFTHTSQESHFIQVHGLSNMPYRCLKCPKRFLLEKRLQSHMLHSHKDDESQKEIDKDESSDTHMEQTNQEVVSKTKEKPKQKSLSANSKAPGKRKTSTDSVEEKPGGLSCPFCDKSCRNITLLDSHLEACAVRRVVSDDRKDYNSEKQFDKLKPPVPSKSVKDLTGQEPNKKHHFEDRSSKYKCKSCGQVLASSKSLLLHCRKSHPDEQLPHHCEACHLGFLRESTLLLHIESYCHVKNRTSSKSTPQSRISKSMSTSSSVSSDSTPSNTCPLCSRSFRSITALKSHLESCDVGTSDTDSNIGSIISSDVENTGRYTSVMNRESRNEGYFCKFCDKLFSSQNDLSIHLETCTLSPSAAVSHSTDKNERSHTCCECGSKFKAYKFLVRHFCRIHGEDKMPFKCVKCSKGFVRKDTLDKHVKKAKHNTNKWENWGSIMMNSQQTISPEATSCDNQSASGPKKTIQAKDRTPENDDNTFSTPNTFVKPIVIMPQNVSGSDLSNSGIQSHKSGFTARKRLRTESTPPVQNSSMLNSWTMLSKAPPGRAHPQTTMATSPPRATCKCPACGQVFFTVDGVETHIRFAHPTIKMAFLCTDCNIGFLHQTRLDQHYMKYHGGSPVKTNLHATSNTGSIPPSFKDEPISDDDRSTISYCDILNESDLEDEESFSTENQPTSSEGTVNNHPSTVPHDHLSQKHADPEEFQFGVLMECEDIKEEVIESDKPEPNQGVNNIPTVGIAATEVPDVGIEHSCLNNMHINSNENQHNFEISSGHGVCEDEDLGKRSRPQFELSYEQGIVEKSEAGHTHEQEKNGTNRSTTNTVGLGFGNVFENSWDSSEEHMVAEIDNLSMSSDVCETETTSGLITVASGEAILYPVTRQFSDHLAINQEVHCVSAVTTLTPACTSVVTTLTPACTSAVTTITPACTSAVTTLTPACTSAVTTITPACTSAVTTLIPACTSAVTTLTPACTSAVTTITPACTSAVTTLIPACTSAVTTLTPACTSSVTTITPACTSAVTTLTPACTSAVTTITSACPVRNDAQGNVSESSSLTMNDTLSSTNEECSSEKDTTLSKKAKVHVLSNEQGVIAQFIGENNTDATPEVGSKKTSSSKKIHKKSSLKIQEVVHTYAQGKNSDGSSCMRTKSYGAWINTLDSKSDRKRKITSNQIIIPAKQKKRISNADIDVMIVEQPTQICKDCGEMDKCKCKSITREQISKYEMWFACPFCLFSSVHPFRTIGHIKRHKLSSVEDFIRYVTPAALPHYLAPKKLYSEQGLCPLCNFGGCVYDSTVVYTCPQCGKRFTNKDLFREHQHDTHLIKLHSLFDCPIVTCRYTSSQKAVRIHMKNRHASQLSSHEMETLHPISRGKAMALDITNNDYCSYIKCYFCPLSVCRYISSDASFVRKHVSLHRNIMSMKEVDYYAKFGVLPSSLIPVSKVGLNSDPKTRGFLQQWKMPAYSLHIYDCPDKTCPFSSKHLYKVQKHLATNHTADLTEHQRTIYQMPIQQPEVFQHTAHTLGITEKEGCDINGVACFGLPANISLSPKQINIKHDQDRSVKMYLQKDGHYLKYPGSQKDKSDRKSVVIQTPDHQQNEMAKKSKSSITTVIKIKSPRSQKDKSDPNTIVIQSTDDQQNENKMKLSNVIVIDDADSELAQKRGSGTPCSNIDAETPSQKTNAEILPCHRQKDIVHPSSGQSSTAVTLNSEPNQSCSSPKKTSHIFPVIDHTNMEDIQESENVESVCENNNNYLSSKARIEVEPDSSHIQAVLDINSNSQTPGTIKGSSHDSPHGVKKDLIGKCAPDKNNCVETQTIHVDKNSQNVTNLTSSNDKKSGLDEVDLPQETVLTDDMFEAPHSIHTSIGEDNNMNTVLDEVGACESSITEHDSSVLNYNDLQDQSNAEPYTEKLLPGSPQRTKYDTQLPDVDPHDNTVDNHSQNFTVTSSSSRTIIEELFVENFEKQSDQSNSSEDPVNILTINDSVIGGEDMDCSASMDACLVQANNINVIANTESMKETVEEGVERKQKTISVTTTGELTLSLTESSVCPPDNDVSENANSIGLSDEDQSEVHTGDQKDTRPSEVLYRCPVEACSLLMDSEVSVINHYYQLHAEGESPDTETSIQYETQRQQSSLTDATLSPSIADETVPSIESSKSNDEIPAAPSNESTELITLTLFQCPVQSCSALLSSEELFEEHFVQQHPDQVLEESLSSPAYTNDHSDNVIDSSKVTTAPDSIMELGVNPSGTPISQSTESMEEKSPISDQVYVAEHSGEAPFSAVDIVDVDIPCIELQDSLFKCPVEFCGSSMNSDISFVEHYNQEHSDLFNSRDKTLEILLNASKKGHAGKQGDNTVISGPASNQRCSTSCPQSSDIEVDQILVETFPANDGPATINSASPEKEDSTESAVKTVKLLQCSVCATLISSKDLYVKHFVQKHPDHLGSEGDKLDIPLHVVNVEITGDEDRS